MQMYYFVHMKDLKWIKLYQIQIFDRFLKVEHWQLKFFDHDVGQIEMRKKVIANDLNHIFVQNNPSILCQNLEM